MNLVVYQGHRRPNAASSQVIMVSFYTRANGRYKSAGERIVADGLRQLGVNFAYEHPWAVEVQGKPRLFYPDFTLKDYGVVVEYAGMQGNQDYDRIMARKEKLYREAAVPVIVLHPEDLEEGWPESLLGELERICERRREHLESTSRRYWARVPVRRQEAEVPSS